MICGCRVEIEPMCFMENTKVLPKSCYKKTQALYDIIIKEDSRNSVSKEDRKDQYRELAATSNVVSRWISCKPQFHYGRFRITHSCRSKCKINTMKNVRERNRHFSPYPCSYRHKDDKMS